MIFISELKDRLAAHSQLSEEARTAMSERIGENRTFAIMPSSTPLDAIAACGATVAPVCVVPDDDYIALSSTRELQAIHEVEKADAIIKKESPDDAALVMMLVVKDPAGIQ